MVGKKVRLAEHLVLPCVRVPIKADSKVAAIEELVNLIADQFNFEPRQDLISSIFARESLTDHGTWIGENVALPHAMGNMCDSVRMAFATTARPIDWRQKADAPGGWAEIIALTVAPNNEYAHAVAHLSRILDRRSTRVRIRSCKTTDEVLAELLRAEELLP